MLPIKQLNMIHKKGVRVLAMLLAATLLGIQPALAADAPAPSLFSNPLAVTLLLLMGVLLIVIAVLANLLIGSADWRLKSVRKQKTAIIKPISAILLLLISSAAMAQDAGGATATSSAVQSIGGLAPSVFYVMVSVVFLELAIILVLLINIRFLVKAAREKDLPETEILEQKAVVKKKTYDWWNKINKFKPVEQEKDIDLGHEYDGIRELDNRLPPWWLWGFYITIFFGIVYLWRYHIAESAPLSEEEFKISMQRGEEEVQAYLKKKGESVDENTVVVLSDESDLAGGEKVYTTSCVACHGAKGEGGVGPNLTDDYWLHGGDIKGIFKTIKYGVDGKGMASWQAVYSPKQIAQVASYIKSLHGTNPPNPKEQQGEFYQETAAPAADSTGIASNGASN